ncbi:MAG TPA: hypothetical protein VF698_12110 [Thermoanaerobaculia bacterium]|jgi:hypothetical protein
MAQPTRGSIDGGFGRGVPITGRKKKETLEDDDVQIVDTGEDLFELESDDSEPADRRRDPLRR